MRQVVFGISEMMYAEKEILETAFRPPIAANLLPDRPRDDPIKQGQASLVLVTHRIILGPYIVRQRVNGKVLSLTIVDRG